MILANLKEKKNNIMHQHDMISVLVQQHEHKKKALKSDTFHHSVSIQFSETEFSQEYAVVVA